MFQSQTWDESHFSKSWEIVVWGVWFLRKKKKRMRKGYSLSSRLCAQARWALSSTYVPSIRDSAGAKSSSPGLC